MKVFLMYYDRYETATTSKMLDINHYVLCHNNAGKFNCIGDNGKLIETGQPKGIQNNFNFGLSMLEDGEWAIFMSDDLVSAKWYNGTKFVETKVNKVLNEMISVLPKCDNMGVKLVGLASSANPIFARGKKYSKYGLVDGRCFAIKKTEFRFHDQINTIPDYYATAYHLNKYKGNLILSYCLLDFKRYEAGGLGTIEARIIDKMKDVRIMCQLFPNNVMVKDKVGQPKGSHIIIKK
jgi:hypothetical protein